MKKIKSIIFSRKYLISLLVLICISEGLVFYFIFNERHYVNCDSFITFRTPKNQFEFNGTMLLKLDNDGRGKIELHGIIKSRGAKTTIDRDALFSYHQLNDASFKMTNLQIVKGSRDNAPDADIALNFFSLELDTRRVLTLHRVGNGYLVGSLRAPTFMCLAL